MYGDRPFVPIVNPMEDQSLKMAHDRYVVKVNGDAVGDKVLLTEMESVDDVAHFLGTRGFHDFETTVDGGDYDIRVADEETAMDIKQHLEVYLNTR